MVPKSVTWGITQQNHNKWRLKCWTRKSTLYVTLEEQDSKKYWQFRQETLTLRWLTSVELNLTVWSAVLLITKRPMTCRYLHVGSATSPTRGGGGVLICIIQEAFLTAAVDTKHMYLRPTEHLVTDWCLPTSHLQLSTCTALPNPMQSREEANVDVVRELNIFIEDEAQEHNLPSEKLDQVIICNSKISRERAWKNSTTTRVTSYTHLYDKIQGDEEQKKTWCDKILKAVGSAYSNINLTVSQGSPWEKSRKTSKEGSIKRGESKIRKGNTAANGSKGNKESENLCRDCKTPVHINDITYTFLSDNGDSGISRYCNHCKVIATGIVSEVSKLAKNYL